MKNELNEWLLTNYLEYRNTPIKIKKNDDKSYKDTFIFMHEIFVRFAFTSSNVMKIFKLTFTSDDLCGNYIFLLFQASHIFILTFPNIIYWMKF